MAEGDMGWGGGGGRGPAQRGESHSERHTEGRGRKKGETRPRGQRSGGGRRVHSEYGGLVLSADSALGFLGVHQPRGAALGLGVPLLFHEVPL